VLKFQLEHDHAIFEMNKTVLYLKMFLLGISCMVPKNVSIRNILYCTWGIGRVVDSAFCNFSYIYFLHHLLSSLNGY
jgi:hypothetical protein